MVGDAYIRWEGSKERRKSGIEYSISCKHSRMWLPNEIEYGVTVYCAVRGRQDAFACDECEEYIVRDYEGDD